MKKVKIQLSFSRKKEISRLKTKLEKESFPRIQMLFIVSITSGCAFLASYLFLHLAGITSMWLRYLLVCFTAYGIFLLFIWLWLRTRLEDFSEVGDISGLPEVDFSNQSLGMEGGGGSFGGGGSSGTFIGSNSSETDLISDSANPVIEAVGAAGEAEEFALPLIVLILILTIVLSSFYVVYTAPILFAELLVDSLLAAGLYKKFKSVESEHWMVTAFKRTIFPFAVTLVVSVTSGYALQAISPEASTIGEFFEILRTML